jgi:hypothetical protein
MAFRNRLCLVTDIEGFGQHTTPQRADAARRLFSVQQFALRQARAFRVQPVAREDKGDGQLMLLPLTLDPTQAVPGLVAGFRHGLYMDNQEPGLFGRLRVRVALARGAVTLRGPLGAEGHSLITACRMNDAAPLKKALRERRDADLAVIVTDDLYQDVIKHDFGSLQSAGFTRIEVQVKEHASAAWMYLPASSPVPGIRDSGAAWKSATAGVVIAGLALYAASNAPPTNAAEAAGHHAQGQHTTSSDYPAAQDHPVYVPPDHSTYPGLHQHVPGDSYHEQYPSHPQYDAGYPGAPSNEGWYDGAGW